MRIGIAESAGPIPFDVWRDARRWRALVDPRGRIRVLGSAGLGAPDARTRHIGLELWNQHPATDSAEGIAQLTQFADESIALAMPIPQPGDIGTLLETRCEHCQEYCLVGLDHHCFVKPGGSASKAPE